MYGWSGRVLRIDLTNRQWSVEPTSQYTGQFIGGRGIDVKIVYDEVDPRISVYDPANRLVFGAGVLCGTPAPFSSRIDVTTLCPNGLIGSAGMGGIAVELKYAGYDNIIVQGKSEQPVYLFVTNDAVEFRDAKHLGGKDTQETQQIIREENADPDLQIMCIGPAGENLVSFACIINGISAAGHGGVGAIMGSKNLKAITVRGKGEVNIAHPEEFLKLSSDLVNDFKTANNAEYLGAMTLKGESLMSLERISGNRTALGNWEDVTDDEVKSLSSGPFAKEFYDRYKVGFHSCYGCSLLHAIIADVPGIGRGAAKCAGVTSFSFPVWNKRYEVIFEADQLCNGLGLDYSSTANTIAFLMELYHRGIITEKDTDGIPMRRGDREAIVSTIHKIATQEGFGKIFKNGVLGAAKAIGRGAEEYAMHIKGMEMPTMDVRGHKALALASAVVTKGMLRGMPFYEYSWVDGEEDSLYYPPSYNKKGFTVWDSENKTILSDMLGICKQIFPWGHEQYLEILAKLFSLATGVETSESNLLMAAQRVQTLERAFDVTRGVRRKDDTLPKRLFQNAKPREPFKGHKLDKKKFAKMLDEYYELRGWDENGIPKNETFAKFGLSSEWETFNQRMNQVEGAIVK